MQISENAKYIAATAGILLFGASYFLYAYQEEIMSGLFPSPSKEVHVHADFALYVEGTHIRFTDDRYQSSANNVKHQSMHFHDNMDSVIHRHAQGVTLGNFFQSVGVTLTNTCLTLDTGASYCQDEGRLLQLYVNGEVLPYAPEYVIQEEDQLLLYYGSPQQAAIEVLQESITSDSCIYSGTCPERGTPPPESCGLTCEI